LEPNPRLTTISLIMMQYSGPKRLRSLCHPIRRSPRDIDQGQTSIVPASSRGNLLFRPVRTELLEIGPEVAGFFFVLDAGENHLGIGNLGARILDVFLEGCLIPSDTGILVGVGVVELGDRAGMTAVKPVEHGADLVFCPFTDRMAGEALL